MSIFQKINNNIIWLIIGALSLLLSLGFLGLGLFPDDTSYLDWSWKLSLHQFFLSNKAFGQEIIFPLGPYGFLYSKTYFPGTYLLTFITWIFFALVFWWSSFWLSFKRLSNFDRPNILIINAIWFLWLLFLLQGSLPDAFFMSFSIFLLTYYFYIDNKKTSIHSILITITLSLICLIKFSFTGSSLAVIFLITINDILEKQKPILLTTFLSSFLLLWLLAGQSLFAIPSFVLNGLTVAQYYSELAFGGTLSEILLVLFTIFLVILPIALNEIRPQINKESLKTALPFLGYLGLSQMAFKAGYTRIDEFHVFTTNKVIIVIALVYLLIIFSQEVKYYIKYLFLLGLLASIMLFSANLNWYGRTNLVKYFKSGVEVLSNNTSLSFSIITQKTDLPATYQDKMAKIRQENPLVPIDGTVDIYSARQTILLAHNLDYRPRPVFQSNMASPTQVAQINVDHLKSNQAPKYILFNNEVIDTRYPSIEDGLCWPELLTLYDIKSFIPKHQLLLLESSKNPSSYSFKNVLNQNIIFNQEVDLSQINSTPLWIKLNIETTLIGKLTSAFWRVPILYLKITLTDGKQYVYYLPREMAKNGFLISPLVNNSVDFAKLASQKWAAELKQNLVKSFTILVEDSKFTDSFFQPNISISLDNLEFPKQELDNLLTELKVEEQKLINKPVVTQLLNLSLSQIQQGDFLSAIISCEKAIEVDQTSASIYNNLGVAYKSISFFDEAIKAFEQAIKLNPDFTLAQNNLNETKLLKNNTVNIDIVITNYTSLTLSYIGNNMFNQAIETCEKSLKISPNNAITYNNLCVAYNGLALWDKAIIAAEKAIALAPDFQLAKNNLAWARSQKEKVNNKN